jgi:hypothetical protein
MSKASAAPRNDVVVQIDLPKKGIKVEHYDGEFAGDNVELNLCETRIFEPSYFPKALAATLTLFASLEAEHQLLFMQMMLAMRSGQKCQLVDIGVHSYIHFPDPHGDPAYDKFIDFVMRDEAQKKSPERASQSSSKKLATSAKIKSKKTTKNRCKQSNNKA